MRKEIIFEMNAPFRDNFRVSGYIFGSGKKSLAIVGPLRGDEIQQQYICSQLVKRLQILENKGAIKEGHEILIIPSANPFSMNIEKRFWSMDGTDINRMFPGYDKGETTQRIAAATFKAIEGFEYGIQMASNYIPGEFIPHVRMMKTGYEATKDSRMFGFPYICIREPKPFDTTLLNFNWQIWNTKAFSVYAGHTKHIEDKSSDFTIEAILRFMKHIGIIKDIRVSPGYDSTVINENKLVTIKANEGGLFYKAKKAGDEVKKDEIIGRIIDPYDGKDLEFITSPTDGIVFFAQNNPLSLQGAPLFKIYCE